MQRPPLIGRSSPPLNPVTSSALSTSRFSPYRPVFEFAAPVLWFLWAGAKNLGSATIQQIKLRDRSSAPCGDRRRCPVTQKGHNNLGLFLAPLPSPPLWVKMGNRESLPSSCLMKGKSTTVRHRLCLSPPSNYLEFFLSLPVPSRF